MLKGLFKIRLPLYFRKEYVIYNQPASSIRNKDILLIKSRLAINQQDIKIYIIVQPIAASLLQTGLYRSIHTYKGSVRRR